MPITTSRISGSATSGLLIEAPLGTGNSQEFMTVSTKELHNYVLYGPVRVSGSLTIASGSMVKIIDIDKP